MSISKRVRPSERQIGARVRINPTYQAEVEALFDDARVAPIHKELRPDGDVSYWFSKDQVAALSETRVLAKIPLHYWAHHAIVGEPPIVH